VHGTAFTVESLPERAGGTTVKVDEGVVAVQSGSREVTLTAGQSWTSRVPAALEPPASDPARAEAKPPDAPKESSSAAKRTAPAPSAGTLDEETHLLRSALAAERRGDLAGAAASLQLLISRYPHSPLVPDARSALARVKAREAP